MIKILKYDYETISQVFIADTFIKRFLGYMFRKEPHYEAILIKPCSSIHTFFMKFNIDVLFLNDDMEVVKKLEDLQPKKMIMPVNGVSMVIESRAGAFKEIKAGTKINIG